jgi:hypothetical protein
MLTSTQQLMSEGLWAAHGMEVKTAAAAFVVGVVVGITGMGGGALMTPALIFLGVGDASSVVTADLTASAVYKSGGAAVHWREGSPNLRLAGFLICGSVPMAFLGPRAIRWVSPGADLDTFLKLCIGFALLLAAATYALRLYVELRRAAKGNGSGPGMPPRCQDRAAHAGHLHQARDPRRLDDVRPGPARQGRMGPARGTRRPDACQADRGDRPRHARRGPVRVGGAAAQRGSAHVRRPPAPAAFRRPTTAPTRLTDHRRVSALASGVGCATSFPIGAIGRQCTTSLSANLLKEFLTHDPAR